MYKTSFLKTHWVLGLFALIACTNVLSAQTQKAHNPIIYADVPDMSIVRVDDTYYMSSTTMHMYPNVPIMKSKDLTNWELVTYPYGSLGDNDELALNNGKNDYGRGSWASTLRYHKGRFYVTTFAKTPNKTYIASTADLEKGPWEVHTFSPAYHDHSLFFDDNGKTYFVYGGGNLHIVELMEDLSGVKPGTDRVLIEDASKVAGENIGLPAEGSQLIKHDGKYYIFNIVWPRGGMRTVLVHRADSITGVYEGRVALQDKGVAQGSIIDTPDGKWFAYLFRDNGAVGRIPYLVPMEWADGWPVLGEEGKVPETLNLPANKSLLPGIVASDDFSRKKKDAPLPLVWQWNHNPNDSLWSVSERKGFLRLTTGRIDTDLLQVQNILTQRTFGPTCAGATHIDLSKMKDGDRTGLMLLQKKYAWVGVKAEKGEKVLVMVIADADSTTEVIRVPLKQNEVYLKAICDFTNRVDAGNFAYSLDGKTWQPIGSTLKMEYTLPHFMGYRFGLFNYATKEAGGFVDFDYFHLTE